MSDDEIKLLASGASLDNNLAVVPQSGNIRKDLLVGVANFFRDPEAFQSLYEKALSQILAAQPANKEIRVWVAGCSTGEEAYSVAILLRKYMDSINKIVPVKIFATDVDKKSVEYASQGLYSDSIIPHLANEDVDRFFIRDDEMFQVNKEIRKMIIFAPHNIVKDPPFSNLDLITCRNMLIHLQPEMQHKVLSLFHFALAPEGFLFLGLSETIGRFSGQFEPLDRHWNIFQHKNTKALAGSQLIKGGRRDFICPASPHRSDQSAAAVPERDKKAHTLHSILSEEHASPCLVVDHNNDVIHLSGTANDYLLPAKGKPNWNLFKLVDSSLSGAIATALHKVREEKQQVVYRSLKIITRQGEKTIDLRIRPFSLVNKAYCNHVVILFEEQELIAANEELQSANKELQAVNEELVTVNTEFQFKIQELTDLNNDMNNFLVSTRIGTIFLDKRMCIRRFTPAITKGINLLEVDCGRPIQHISHQFKQVDLVADATNVLHTLIPLEKEIQSKNGAWYSMRILPYRTEDNFVNGVVLTFVDITDLKSVNEELTKLSYAIDQSPSITIITDIAGAIEYVNPKFTSITGFSLEDTQGSSLRLFSQWGEKADAFGRILKVVLDGDTWTGELMSNTKDGGFYWESVKIIPIKNNKGDIIHFLKVSEDISERKHAEEMLRKTEMLSAVGQLAAGIAHEIRNPLTALKGFTKLITTKGAAKSSYVDIMLNELDRIEQIVSELLVLAKPQAVDFKAQELEPIIQDVLMLLESQAIMNNVEMSCQFDTKPLRVFCVENQLKQVFINVVKNAIEAMGDGGKIRVHAALHEDGRIVIGFSDNGPGIPESKLNKLGEPFYSTKEKGTGLGLTVSYKIIESHQGAILFQSKEGAGTTVTITLPAASLPAQA